MANTMSFDEPGLYLIVPSGKSEFVKSAQDEVNEYATVKGRVVFLYHLTKVSCHSLLALAAKR